MSNLLSPIFARLVAMSVATSAAADEREYVYAQKTGELKLDGKVIAEGYSGKGVGKDNPDKGAVKNVGPIPRGAYVIGPARVFRGMADCVDLTPDGHDAHGRTEFLIHGDSKTDPGNASEGCIILGPDVRKQIVASGIKRLRVVSE